MEEYVDILTKNGIKTGNVCTKKEVHNLGLWHASIQLWIVNSKQEVLIQKRASNKDSYPGLWDISVAGHLTAGDTPEIAAIRETKEEIGLNIQEKDLIFLKKVKRSKTPKASFFDNEFNYLYLLKNDFSLNELVLQEDEVDQVKLISVNEFKQQLKQNKDIFVPHGETYYAYIINEILLLK